MYLHAPDGVAISCRENRTLSHFDDRADADGYPEPNQHTGANLYFSADQHAAAHAHPHADTGTDSYGYANPWPNPNSDQHALA